MQILFNDQNWVATITDDVGNEITVTNPADTVDDWNIIKAKLGWELNPSAAKAQYKTMYEAKLNAMTLPDGVPMPKDIIALIMTTKFPTAKLV